MEKTKFMTKEQREKLSNRLVLNFGLLLLGALILLWVFSFVNAYQHAPKSLAATANVIGVFGIIAAVLGLVFLIVGIVKAPKIRNYCGAFFGMAAGALIIFAPKFKFMQTTFPKFTMFKAIELVAWLMVAYFVVFAIVTGIILKLHPEAPVEKKKIQHAKKKNKKR